jgi:hypothetical protein
MIFSDDERRFVLPRKLGDRIVVFIFGSVLTAFFALMSFRLDSTPLPGWLGKVLRGVVVEAMFAFAVFSGLALIWALFTPRWLEALINQGTRKVMSTIVVVLISAAFTILYFTL